ncbi:MAG: hypothetical protein AVDCRST_MAG88-1449 [uncultured Thermomicrobiales bacterium]|uniref:MaoC-like domain-containing protein n=1 Tax=uncultured Thermomicrobiales bacterium TaxID=1645740 RepID=A0A6J4UTW6_9BACT|nr:MAG: hypothetical protein AVDCRST_MAG88-1449 [uncultured Thermomicrobiales bacterium]
MSTISYRPAQDYHHLLLALRGLARRQRLTLPPAGYDRRASFRFTDEARDAWYHLFQVPTEAPLIPFLYHSPLNVMGLHHFLGRLRVNFRNIVHLRTDLAVAPAFDRDFRPGATYQHRALVEDVTLLRADRAVAVFGTEVTIPGGGHVYRSREYFGVNNLSPRDAATLRTVTDFGRTDVDGLRGQARRTRRLVPEAHRRIAVPRDMGRAYGLVSGDRNVVHTNARLSRLFGYRGAFIQGLCTAQLALKVLCHDLRQPLGRLTITYCRPVYVGQTIDVVVQGTEMEILDSTGGVLAAGDWRSPADHHQP